MQIFSQPKLSLIMPVYNGSKYLECCITSIIAIMPDFCELIIVNDGSSDDSENVIFRNFTQEVNSNKIRYFFQKNQGVSVARNSGIAISKGRYIGFIDCDDMISDNYFSTLLPYVENETADIIEFGFKLFSEGENISQNKEMFVHEHAGQVSRVNYPSIFSSSIWYPVTRIYKRDLLNFRKELFPKGVRFCEDLMVLPYIYERANNIFHIKKALYYYRMNSASATFNVRPDYAENLIIFYRSLLTKEQGVFTFLKMNIFYILFDLVKIRNGTINDIPVDIRNDITKN